MLILAFIIPFGMVLTETCIAKGMSNTIRNKILKELLMAKQTVVSGQQLAEKLGISRAAVWKHMQVLKKSGFGIVSMPRSGYRLAVSADLPIPELLQPLLTTEQIGRKYCFYPRLESTNLEARRQAEAGTQSGTLIVADEQTGGRGRRGRSWLSLPGTGIWASVVLRPSIPTGQAGALMLSAAVAVREAIVATTGVNATIKWPNDILINGKKVCGILVELAADQETLNWAVIGIGLNIRPPEGGFPTELINQIITLEEASGTQLCRPVMLARLCLSLENWYRTVESGNLDAVVAAWRAGCDWLGSHVTVHQGDKSFQAIAEDIEPDGGLRVRDSHGQVKILYAGEVTLRRHGS